MQWFLSVICYDCVCVWVEMWEFLCHSKKYRCCCISFDRHMRMRRSVFIFFFYWLQFYYLSRDQCQLDIIMYPCDLWTSIEHVFVFVILLRGRWCVVCSGYWFIGEERQFFFLIHKWIWSTWSRKKCGNFPKKNTEKKYAHRLLYLNSNCIKLWMPVLNYWCVVYLHNPCAPSLSIPSAENMILQQQQRRQQ